jgi:thiosulfate/3-mercaptopyruvate sulfurtransferase
MTAPSPAVIDAAGLAALLGAADLVVLDATAILTNPADGGPHVAESGRAGYETEHIPGAVHADLVRALSEPSSPHHFTAPSVEQFTDAASALGIGPGVRVVVYDRVTNLWATRLWWLLRRFGFDDVVVLDGGLEAWRAAGHATESGSVAPMRRRFIAAPRPELLATKDDVAAVVAAGSACVLSASRADIYRGQGPSALPRVGHIPGSRNLPASDLLGPDNRLLPVEELRQRFAAAGVLDESRIVVYCGGGIAATLDAWALYIVGRPDVAVYDGSLIEWSHDPSLPLVVGADS